MENNTFAMAGEPLRTRPRGFFGLSAYLESFIRSRKALDRSPRTLDEYRLAVRVFSDYLIGCYSDDDLRRVTRREIRDFTSVYLQAGHTSTTANKTLRGLRALFNWLWREEEIAENPFARVQLPPADKSPREGFSTAEVKAMLRVCERRATSPRAGFLAARDFSILVTMFDTGLRASEITAMTADGFDWQSGLFMVPGKGRKLYQRHLGDRALAAVDKYLRLRRRLLCEAGGPLWVNWKGGPLTRSGLRRMCILRGQQAGVGNATTPAPRVPSLSPALLDQADNPDWRQKAGARLEEELLGRRRI